MKTRKKNEKSFLMVNKVILIELGANAAIILADLMSKEQYFRKRGGLTPGGMFFNSHSNIEADTGLARKAQVTAFARFREHGLVDITPKTGNANYFKINLEKIDGFIRHGPVRKEHGDPVRREQGGMSSESSLPCSERTPNNNKGIRTQNDNKERCASLELESSSSSAPSTTGLTVKAGMNPAEEKKPLPLSAEPEVRREPMTVRQDAESVVSRLSATRMAIVSRLGYDPIEVYKTFGDWFKARPADADAGLWFDL